MVWLAIVGLVVWCLVQQTHLSRLNDLIDSLKLEISDLRASWAGTRRGEAAAPEAAPVSGPAAPDIAQAAVQAPATPAPGWSPELAAEVMPSVSPAARPTPVEVLPPPAPPPSPTPGSPRQAPSLSEWLSENGLAWIGGGALALGGLFLVAYAAERGLFTPPFRIGSAVILGLLALVAGEYLRRGGRSAGPPNLLVSALTTAAGAAILYAATWASFRLYGFIPAGAAAILLAAVSLGLLTLALLHGEALGVLAVAAAYAVPVVSGSGDMRGWPVDAFVFAILSTGIATAGLRRWTVAGGVSLAGAGIWAVARAFLSDQAGLAVLAAAAPMLTLIAIGLESRPGRIRTVTPTDRFKDLFPAAAIGAALLAFIPWSIFEPDAAPYGALVMGMTILAIAFAVRAGKATSLLLGVPALVAVLAATAGAVAPAHSLHIVWLLPVVALLAVAGLDGALRSANRREAALIGAAGTALTLTLASGPLASAVGGLDGLIDAGFAALLAGGAVMLARRGDDAGADLATAAWIAAAAEACGLALHASLNGQVAPAAYGLLGAVLAVLAVRVRWRGFAESAALACLGSFAALLAQPVMGAALDGQTGWLVVGGAAAGAALTQATSWRVLKARPDVTACAEAVSTLAVMSALLGAFLVLEIWGIYRSGATAALDEFTRASLRTLLLLAAGLTLCVRGAATPIGRLRGPILLALGALHGLVLEGIFLNSWWGAAGTVIGPPVFDGLLLGLLAPALLLAQASRRLAGHNRAVAGAAFASAVVFACLWIATELRRLFHGPALAGGPFGYAETAAYAAAAIAVVLGLQMARARLTALLQSRDLLPGVLDAITWGGLFLGSALLAYVASPWWGPLEGGLRAPMLLGSLYLAGIGILAALAFVARRSARSPLAHAALVAAGVELFVFLTLIVRHVFHGGAMRAALREASLETWTFSVVWAVYGLAVLAAGASRKDAPLRGLGLAILLATTLKVFLFDLARLEGVIRAASFLALGVALLIGAFAARRLGASADQKGQAEGPGGMEGGSS